MREPRVCPGCGIRRYGCCPFCYPQAAEQERRAELAADLAAEEDRARRDAGLLFCPEHEVHDGCYRVRSAAEVRAELRGGEPAPDWRTAVTFEQRMAVLRRRYASP